MYTSSTYIFTQNYEKNVRNKLLTVTTTYIAINLLVKLCIFVRLRKPLRLLPKCSKENVMYNQIKTKSDYIVQKHKKEPNVKIPNGWIKMKLGDHLINVILFSRQRSVVGYCRRQ